MDFSDRHPKLISAAAGSIRVFLLDHCDRTAGFVITKYGLDVLPPGAYAMMNRFLIGGEPFIRNHQKVACGELPQRIPFWDLIHIDHHQTLKIDFSPLPLVYHMFKGLVSTAYGPIFSYPHFEKMIPKIPDIRFFRHDIFDTKDGKRLLMHLKCHQRLFIQVPSPLKYLLLLCKQRETFATCRSAAGLGLMIPE